MSKLKVQGLAGKVVMVADKPEEIVKGGIFIPKDAQTAPFIATIVDVGPGIKDAFGTVHEPQFVVGDRVSYSQYGGAIVRIGDDPTEYIVTKEENIIAKIVEVGEDE